MITVFWIAPSLYNNLTHLCESIKSRSLTSLPLFHYPKPWWWWTSKIWTEEPHCDTRDDNFSFFQDIFRKAKLSIGYHCAVPIRMIKWGWNSLSCELLITLRIYYAFNSNRSWVQSVMLEFWESKSAWGKMLKSKQTKLHCNWCFDNLQNDDLTFKMSTFS